MIKGLWKRITLLVAASLLGVFFSVGGSTAAQAEPVPSKAHNIGNVPILMCRYWTTSYGDGRNQRGTCKYTGDGGLRCTIYADRNTHDHCFWSDFQGFYVRRDYTVATRAANGIFWTRWGAWGWTRKRTYVVAYNIKEYHK